MDTSLDSEDGQHLQLDATNSEEAMADQVADDNETKSDKSEAKKTLQRNQKATVSALQLVNDFTNSMNENLIAATSRADMLEIYNKLNKTLSNVVTAMMKKGSTPITNSLETDKS